MTTPRLLVGAFLACVAASEYSHHEKKKQNPLDVTRHHLAYEIVDAPTSSPTETFVMLHGWPDDVRLFAPLARKLVEANPNYRCVNCNLPGYPVPEDFMGVRENVPREREIGYDFAEAAELLYATVLKTVRPGEKITLVIHDWGCVVGYKFQQSHPEMVKRMVCADVGILKYPPSPVKILAVILYQMILNLAFLSPIKAIGDAVTRIESVVLLRTAAPGGSTPCVAMNWPYRSTFREVLTYGTLPRLFRSYRPHGFPILFVYGRYMPSYISFHDQKWYDTVTSSHSLSAVAGLPGFHWFMNSHPEPFLREVLGWIERTKGASSSSSSL